MSRKIFGTTVLAGLLLLGCSSSDGSDVAIAAGPLSGNIDGTPWSFVSAETDAFLSEGSETYFASLYAETVTGCSGSASATHLLILLLPRSPGDYPLDGSVASATFNIQEPGSSLAKMAHEGHVTIDEITVDRIRGGAYVHIDDQNTLNGRFEIAICP